MKNFDIYCEVNKWRVSIFRLCIIQCTDWKSHVQSAWPKLNDTTLHMNSIEQRYLNSKTTGKIGSRSQKSEVLINTTK